jgi:hypothetical protein
LIDAPHAASFQPWYVGAKGSDRIELISPTSLMASQER